MLPQSVTHHFDHEFDNLRNLRVRVMQSNDWRERRALRELDERVIRNLPLLGFTPADRSKLGPLS